MNVSVADSAVSVQVESASIGIGIDSVTRSSVYAEATDGDVVLYEVTATDENEDGNVVLSGDMTACESDGNVKLVTLFANATGITVGSASVSVTVPSASVSVAAPSVIFS